MDFLIKALVKWLGRDGHNTCAFYGVDGSFIASTGKADFPNEFIPEATNQMSAPWTCWSCFPITADGEYCGCVLSFDNDRHGMEILDAVLIAKAACEM